LTTPPWDVLIVGGGLGGLSLAVELAQPQHAHLRVLVLERRIAYERDRTWSYWCTQAHRYSALERRRWRRWSVRFEGGQQTQDSDIAYGTIDADAFYARAQAVIAEAPHVQLRMASPVRSVRSVSDAAVHQVRLEDGSCESARWVMDGRPAKAVSGASSTGNRSGLFQHFLGWEIRTTVDCFDDQQVELMDFQAAANGLHFWYVLPYSPRNALIETTWISSSALTPDYEAELRSYLQARYGLFEFERVYQEAGCLPLPTRQPPAPGPGIVRLGQAAGTLRPSTGFAFLETLADARRIANCLARAGPDTTTIASYQRRRLDNWMDQVFFEAMQADWSAAPRYFMALFEGTPAPALVAFLSGQATLAQRCKVAMQLPKTAFLRAAWRCLTV
jgi:lycopene beta-cyclase